MAYISSRKHPVTRHALSAATATLMTGMALTQPALAADAPADTTTTTTNAKNLDGVQVQASTTSDYKVDNLSSPKYTQPILDTTQTISVISKDLFLQQGATTLTEALRNSPGVGTFYVGENGTTSTGDSIYMRGFDTSGSIFVDGARDLGTISRDVFNTESVEVIKGPASTDNGRTAPTGAINMVSKQPELANSVSASLSYGSADQRRVTADWNQAVSNTSAFRLNVMGQDSGVPGRDQVENNRWGVAPSFAFGLGTATRVYVDYMHVRQNNVPDGGVPTIGLPGYSSPDPKRPFLGNAPEVDSSNFYGTTADHDHVTADMFTTRIEHDFNDQLAFHNTFRWGRTAEDYLLTSFMGTAANLLTPNPTDPSTWTIARSNPTFKHQANRIITDQANLTATFETGAITHNLSTGIELTQEKATTVGLAALNGTTWPAANLYDPNWDVSGLNYGQTGAYSNAKTNTASAYVFDTLKFAEHWQVNAGVRMDHYDTDYSSMVQCGAKNGPVCGTLPTGSVVQGLDTKAGDNLWNWKLGVLYKPMPNGSFYLNYAVSAEPPGGNTLTLSGSANSQDNPNLQPERARTYEVGTKWELLDEKLLLTGALYQTTVSNDLVQDPVTLLYYQIGQKRVQGVELSAVGKLTENWGVSAGFTTMNASVLSGTAVAEDGSSDLAYTPKKAFTSWTSYLLPFGLTIGGGARYNGDMQRGTDSAIGTPAYTKAYWVVDAMASYPISKNFDLRLNVYNLFDKDYVAAINKSGYRYTPGTPRSAMITANIRF
ncbi:MULTISPECIES: catecholate siderophore receptor Fiu [unclassified Dyella]|uniref:catecholate siderophore receptor Fiu n=1 Tax=unclassified Dyella TaxID=2634549 RepID=UPI000C824659|nr:MULTISPECIES: catecholate siderophore receptor Fiu [unclassified Dyella]MDR3444580.1 catecholate siderophore receptor Fiu [Dyella sp.]PMQ05638.1 Catecholate siderophore receptor Fiu [Dyella sp. AD56]